MTRRKYPIKLIDLTYSPTASGDSISEAAPREVLADRKSVSRAEFYPAVANGLRPEVTFVIWADEYNNEERLTYNDTDYEIIRTFSGTDEREIELVCQRLESFSTGLSALRHQVTIQVKQPSGAWIDFATVWAAIEPVSAKENIDRSDVEQSITHKIKIRYREGVISTMRVVYGGQLFSIESVVDPTERKLELELICEELPPLLDQLVLKRQQRMRGPRNEAILQELPPRKVSACIIDIAENHSASGNDPVKWTYTATLNFSLEEDISAGDVLVIAGRGDFFVTELNPTKNFLKVTAIQEKRGME